jgi:hypothetical protein
MTMEMAELLVEHLGQQTRFLESLDGPFPGEKRTAFTHN